MFFEQFSALHKQLLAAIFASCLALLSGCAVVMAENREPDPDLGPVKEGTSRAIIESELGEAVSETTDANGYKIAQYAYELGAGRNKQTAQTHLYLDVITLGLWELPATLFEATKGKDYLATITYDENDVAMEVSIARLE